jgi:hypothetical protein
VQPPKAVTLPYNYTKLPATVPAPPATVTVQEVEAVTANFKQISDFIETSRAELRNEYTQWREGVDRREVEEKRRIAPGYLDTGNRLLQPVRKTDTGSSSNDSATPANGKASPVNDIDKVFGKISL